MIASNLNQYSSNKIKAKVELYNGSTLVTTCTCSDVLSDFKISREGELGKFFGFGVSHSLKMKLIDINKVLSIKEGYTAKVCLGDGEVFDCPYPELTMTDVTVDKKSGDITITAFDPLYKASEILYEDLGIPAPYTIYKLAEDCATALGVTLNIQPYWTYAFQREYPEGANFGGSETLRTVLNQIAEVTQTIYYINNKNELVFMVLGASPVMECYESDYYEFETGETKRLKGICSATELGENIESEKDIEGVIQYVRDNPFWDALEGSEVATLVDEAVWMVGGLELVQFDLDWTGNYLLEIGDPIGIYSGNEYTQVYVLNDVITYAGTLSEKTSWSYKDNDTDTPSNTSSLGDKLNQTFAKVDKSLNEITLLASEVQEYDDRIGASESQVASLQMTTSSIIGSVTRVEQNLSTKVNGIEQEVDKLSDSVSTAVTADDVQIIIKQELQSGIDKIVTTEKRYTLDDTGLTVADPNSDISTMIDNDGMTITTTQLGEVLDINNTGVNAQNLRATTYLHIGNTSRFEDWTNNQGETRTACFWMGG